MDSANVLDKSYFHQVPNTFLHFRGEFLRNQFISATFVSSSDTHQSFRVKFTSKHQVQVCCCCWVSLPTLPREQWCFALFQDVWKVFVLEKEGKTICYEMGQWTKSVVNSIIESCNIKVTFSNQRALTRSICWGFRRL